ncbi:hypothetical protein EDB84DRAFT_1583435 [Lactarius hengduanensis]|nr:hypothetical protein EDB84DRAFT_1583435 [Lactarius hengduanensis]
MGPLVDLITTPENSIYLSKFFLASTIFITRRQLFTPISPSPSHCSSTVPLGEYFQIQDDYLDYSGTPEQIGKIDTDIVDNNARSWTPTTGRNDPEAEARVKEVFCKVGVDAVYAEYSTQSYARINALISTMPEVQTPNGDAVLRRTVCRSFLEDLQTHQVVLELDDELSL